MTGFVMVRAIMVVFVPFAASAHDFMNLVKPAVNTRRLRKKGCDDRSADAAGLVVAEFGNNGGRRAIGSGSIALLNAGSIPERWFMERCPGREAWRCGLEAAG